MAEGGYDGSIRINTKIDPAGFNQGTKKMTSGLTGVMGAVKKFGDALQNIALKGGLGLATIGTGIKSVISAIGNLGAALSKNVAIAALLLLGTTFLGVVRTIRESMGTLFERAGFSSQVDEIKARFEEMKLAFANMFLPLITIFLPYIKIALTWLTELFNKIAMITAALMGQKNVLQVVAGSAKSMAKNTKEAAKETTKALAAFDQINVLDKKPGADTPDATTADTVVTKMVPITDDILSKVQAIKDEIAGWISDPWGKIQQLWGNVAAWFKTNVTDPIVEWWNQSWLKANVWEPMKQTASDLWTMITTNGQRYWEVMKQSSSDVWSMISQNAARYWEAIKQLGSDAWSTIQANALNAWTFIQQVWAAAVEFFTNLWNNFNILAHDAWVTLVYVWGQVAGWFSTNVVEPLKAKFAEGWENIKKVWGVVSAWFRDNIVTPLSAMFGPALETVKKDFEGVFGGIKLFITGVINDIVDLINSMLRGLTDGINSMIGNLNNFGTNVPGWIPIPMAPAPYQIPRLATGAVLPPNSAFAAIVSDQKSGMNIESPVELMRQTFEGVLSNMPAQKVVVTFQGDMATFVQAMMPTFKQETIRNGGSLIRSGVTG